MSESVKSPLEMFYQWESETPDKVYLRQASGLEWAEYTWAEVADSARRIAAFLQDQDFPAGSRIAIWSSNSKDWIISDLAIMLSGHISVPIYPGQDIESARYICSHADIKLVFCGEFDQSRNLQQVINSDVVSVSIHGCTCDTDTTVGDITSRFKPLSSSPIPDPDDVFTILYTSGTTGNPKGVMHMHQTPGHVVPGIASRFRIGEAEDRLFSFLPLSHAAERIAVEMTSLYANAPISFSEGLETFGDEIRSVQPTFFFAVPRLWIKFKQGIDAVIPPEAQAQLTQEQKTGIARQLGLAEARIIITGSAPCPRDVQDWFLDMGIALRDGYGMTENFIDGCGWMEDDKPLSGCVGKPFGECKVRLSEQGEIQFKSKGLMKGYYLNPEKTAEVFDDGWYCTGDSGRFDENGNLWVTGRISEVFKTSKGKFIVPTRIEDMFARGELLAQFCIFGHGKDQPLLMATLSEIGQAASQTAIKAELEYLLETINSEVPAHERVAQIFITPEWTIENALLTSTMKIKRKAIEESFNEAVVANQGGDKVVFL